MDTNLLKKRFDEERAKTQNHTKQLYKQIESSIVNQGNLQNPASAIADMEAEIINTYLLDLRQSVKAAAVEQMEAAGIPYYMTAAAWNEILKEVGTPQIKLCEVKMSFVAPPTQESPRKKNPLELASNEKQYNVHKMKTAGLGVCAGGIAVCIVSLLVPSWSAMRTILLSFGTLLVIAGGSTAAIAEMKRQQESKILTSDTGIGREARKEELSQLVHSICTDQYKLNVQKFCAWIDQVEQLVLRKCESSRQ